MAISDTLAKAILGAISNNTGTFSGFNTLNTDFITNINIESPVIGDILIKDVADVEQVRTVLVSQPLVNQQKVFQNLAFMNNTGVSKLNSPEFEKWSKNYINSSPEILFIAEYIVDDVKVGFLIAWEKYFDSTHYHVFKKNTLKSNDKFERILVLDANSLKTESEYYYDYVTKTLNLNVDVNNTYIILDTSIKEDRVYEYKITAQRVPLKIEQVDFDSILESKKLTKTVNINEIGVGTIFDFAEATLGSVDLAWVVALMNDKIPFFGTNSLNKRMTTFDLEQDEFFQKFVLIPSRVNNVLTLLSNCIYLFGVKNTISHFLKLLGGLGLDFRDAFILAIDEKELSFSYDVFFNSIKSSVPSLNISLQIAETANVAGLNRLSKLSIVLPVKTGTEKFMTLEGMSAVLKYVNTFYVSAIYSQDNSIALQRLLDNILNPPTTAHSLEGEDLSTLLESKSTADDQTMHVVALPRPTSGPESGTSTTSPESSGTNTASVPGQSAAPGTGAPRIP